MVLNNERKWKGRREEKRGEGMRAGRKQYGRRARGEGTNEKEDKDKSKHDKRMTRPRCDKSYFVNLDTRREPSNTTR